MVLCATSIAIAISRSEWRSARPEICAGHPAKALAMLKKGCELGSPGACENVKKVEAGK